MGSLQANEIATSDLSIRDQIHWQLTVNHYPPVPSSMIEPCIQAIEACNDYDFDREITLPEGVTYRGSDTAPASEMVRAHHLDSWIDVDEDEL
jgi:hypothetical protein